MNICVIKPSMIGKQTGDALPPLLFAILQPLTPPDVKLVFCDENIEPVSGDIICDAAAISIDTFTARRGYTLAAKFRERGVPVILGGIHATLCPDEAEEYADAVVIGEAEDTWGAVLADLREGKLKPRYVSKNNADLSETKYDYSVFDGKRYNPIQIVQFSRGCRYSCDFCSIHALYGNTLRTRPAKAVAETLNGLPKKLLFFSDDNLLAGHAKTGELLDAVLPLRRRWVCQISIDAAKDMDLLRRLRRSGCVMVIMGFESLDPDNLRQMNKNANLAADYEAAIANIHHAGLMIYGTFVIGYDADNEGTAGRLAGFARKHGFAIANFNPLIPTPGTALYDRLKRENRLLYTHWWNDPDCRYGDTVFEPKGMTPLQLAESCRRTRYTFYSLRGIIARLRGVNAGGPFNAWVFILANIVSARSIRRKQGKGIGG
ncbi:MAG: B12-binding domain-containing radical SAM protein [Clostridiales bacterium]|nr:B12-binding domain-containing radical SAM protein [Clostridiales bacterium]